MRPTKTIGDLIAEHMLIPGDVPEKKPESEYIVSGLRAATFVNLIARRKILTDVAEVLGCRSEDLEFLFADAKKSSQKMSPKDFSLPDYRDELFAVAE